MDEFRYVSFSLQAPNCEFLNKDPNFRPLMSGLIANARGWKWYILMCYIWPLLFPVNRTCFANAEFSSSQRSSSQKHLWIALLHYRSPDPIADSQHWSYQVPSLNPIQEPALDLQPGARVGNRSDRVGNIPLYRSDR